MDFAPVARFGILLVRPGALLLTVPGFSGATIPAMARIGLTVLLAAALAPAVPLPQGPDAGVVLVLARALIAGAELAGHICSQQIGFSYGATIDPVGGTRNAALASLYGLLATFTWLAMDGHHLLFRALHASYTALPIGGGGIDASLVASVREVLALVFVTGVRLAAPVVAVILLVEVALGIISRSAPALNFFVIGYPVRLIVGLAVVAVTIGTVPGVTRALVERVVTAAAGMAAAFR